MADRAQWSDVDRILTSFASRSDEDRAAVLVVRQMLREQEADPTLALLGRSLDRQADAMDAMSKEVPAAIGSLRADLHNTMTRTILVLAVLALVLMSGLVGTTIVLTADEVRVNAVQSSTAPPLAPTPPVDFSE